MLKNSKAFLFSDLHASLASLRMIEAYINKHDNIELLIFAGDFLNSGRPISFANEFIRFIKETGRAFYWVSGNNDFGEGYELLDQIYPSFEGREGSYAGWRFTGIAGSPFVWEGDGRSGKIPNKENIAGSIFLGHYPPPGRREYARFEAAVFPTPVRENPKSKCQRISNIPNPESLSHDIGNSDLPAEDRLAHSPLLHICGHLHNQEGLAYLGKTKIVKLGAAAWGKCALLDLETLTVEFVRL